MLFVRELKGMVLMEMEGLYFQIMWDGEVRLDQRGFEKYIF